jgi:hypothetical protein
MTGLRTPHSPTLPSSQSPHSPLGFLPPILGLLQSITLLVVVFALWGFYRGDPLWCWLLLPTLLLSFVPYFIAVYACAHPQALTTVRAIVFFAALIRVILWTTPPVLSDDVFRYVWEGRVQNHGFDPYSLAPNSDLLIPLRDDIYDHVNHKDSPAIYPPLAQLVFRGLACLPYPIACSKLFFGGLDVLNVWLLILILRHRRACHQFALIYAWNPLPALEFAGSGHLQSLAICLFLAAFLAVQRRREILAAVIAATALSTHFLIWFPLAHIYNVLKKQWIPLIGVICALLYLPSLSRHSFDGLIRYGAAWRFNDSGFSLLVRWFDDHQVQLLDTGVYLSYRRPKIIAAAILVTMGLWFIFREKEWLRAGYLMTGTALLLSPTVHPWYLTLILPFLCFYRNLGWLTFTATVTLAYWSVMIAHESGVWPAITLFSSGQGIEITWIGWLEYGPLLLLLLWNGFSSRKHPTSA